MRQFKYYAVRAGHQPFSMCVITINADEVEISDEGSLRFLRMFMADGLSEPKLRVVAGEPPAAWTGLQEVYK